MWKRLVLLASSAICLAGPKEDAIRILEIQLEGARKVAALTREEHARIKARFESGAVQESDVLRTERADLDARVRVARLESDVAAKRDDDSRAGWANLVALAERIVDVETRRLRIARLQHEAGRVDALELLEREREREIAAVTLRYSRRIADKRRDVGMTQLGEMTRETARIRKSIANRRLAIVKTRVEAGTLDRARLIEARIEQVKAETALAAAEAGIAAANSLEEKLKKLAEPR